MNVARRLTEALSKRALCVRLKSQIFTIVSNNCWGAHIYQNLGQPYQTPFIGIYFAPECYIVLLSRFRWFLDQPIHFVDRSRHDYVNAYRKKENLHYPIGCLGGEVEVQFLHYASESDAIEKWNRRLKRVCSDDSKLFFKFCDRDGCTSGQLAAFDQVPFQNKVCFVSRPATHLRSAVPIPSLHENQVPDGLTLSRISPRYFDAAGWINGSDGRPRWWQPLRCA